MVHQARWGRLLIGMSSGASAILLGVSFLMWRDVPEIPAVRAVLVVLPPIVLFGGLLFCIRSYRLDGAHLYVRRLLWETEVDLRELESVEIDPTAMQRSIRIFGNGGLFSFSGRYRNRKLGGYRAFVTDLANLVVLRLASQVVVLSPADAEAFVEDLLMHNGGVERLGRGF